MRKPIVLASLLLLLAGCSEADWSYITPGDTQAAYPPAPTTSAPASAAAENYARFNAAPTPTAVASGPTTAQGCTRAAQDRMADAAQQDFDDEVQQRVYDGTYADCMHWASRTGGP